MRERYDESNPDPAYHAEWSRRYVARAAVLSWVAIGLAVVAVTVLVLRLAGVLS